MAITDALSHVPGADYNTDVRPGLGLTFPDLVFGETWRQLSDIGANAAADDLYAHCWANANGTYLFHNNSNIGPTFDVVSSADGSIVASNQPYGGSANRSDVIWHPTNPDKYLFQSGSTLMERTVSTLSSVTVHDFGTTLENLGGSENWCDKTGRYFIVRWGGFGRVYDRQTNTVYTGDIPPAQSTGWFGMTPSGNHVITAKDTNGYHISYLINHGAQTVDTVGIKYWNCCGDHGVPVSGSDGKDYVITADCGTTQGLYRVDVTLDQNGRTEAQQTADNSLLLDNIGNTMDFHASHGPNGAGQDWVFVDTEALTTDTFDSSPSWVKYKQEIIAVNYMTGARRRLAHHRSRSLSLSYYYQPRVSCAWDASLVIWASNMNDSTPSAYSDFYGIRNPLGAIGNFAMLIFK